MHERDTIQIPVVSIPPHPDTFRPNLIDRQGVINQALENCGQTVFSSQNHQAITHYAVARHVPKPHRHDILWITPNTEKSSITDWENHMWEGLKEDHVFWGQMENYVRNEQRNDSNLRFYMMLGFHLGQTRYHFKYQRAQMTQERPHGHLVHPLDTKKHGNGYQDLSDPNHLREFAHLTDYAGQKFARVYFENLLSNFGQPVPYKQTLGTCETQIEVERLFFGFDSLYDAFVASRQLYQKAQKHWDYFAKSLTLSPFRLPDTDITIHPKQGAIPGGALIIPSTHDHELGLPNKTLVIPFTVSSPQALLTPGGVHIKR